MPGIQALRTLTRTLTILIGITFSSLSSAQDSTMPSEILLQVTQIKAGRPDGPVIAIDEAVLRQIPAQEIVTTTPWTDGPHRFRGVALRRLLTELGHEGKTVQALALNDYAVTIPGAETTDSWPIVAYEMDGTSIPRRTKGPLWVVYPFDRSTSFQTETTYSRSIWQLNRIYILDE